MTEEQFAVEYHRLAHAVQSGVAATLEQDVRDMDKGKVSPTAISTSTKMLRTGINMALVDSGALTMLLIEKGLATREDVQNAQLFTLRKEVERYEAELSQRMGVKVSLG